MVNGCSVGEERTSEKLFSSISFLIKLMMQSTGHYYRPMLPSASHSAFILLKPSLTAKRAKETQRIAKALRSFANGLAFFAVRLK